MVSTHSNISLLSNLTGHHFRSEIFSLIRELIKSLTADSFTILQFYRFRFRFLDSIIGNVKCCLTGWHTPSLPPVLVEVTGRPGLQSTHHNDSQLSSKSNKTLYDTRRHSRARVGSLWARGIIETLLLVGF